MKGFIYSTLKSMITSHQQTSLGVKERSVFFSAKNIYWIYLLLSQSLKDGT